jgi:hypothetical protein
VFSKRTAEIDEYMETRGFTSRRARGMAARRTRTWKDHTPPDELVPGWLAELDAAGYPARDLAASVERAAAERGVAPERLSDAERARLVGDLLDPDGPLAHRKVFQRTDVIVATGPLVYGRHAGELWRLVDQTLKSAEVIPLVGVAAARDRASTTVNVLAR